MKTVRQKNWVVIPASGVGSRMQSDVPKQYLPFNGSTVIETTLDNLLSHDDIVGAVVVLSDNDSYWNDLAYQNDKPVLIAKGADERFGSVMNGLSILTSVAKENDLWVMIHDAVRPCITHEDLDSLIKASEVEAEGVFLAHPVADTLKTADTEGYCISTVDRSMLWRAFTPQMFPYDLIVRALSHVIKNDISVTDDVSSVEALGLKPKIILGRSDNIKITYPQDILIAETIVKNR